MKTLDLINWVKNENNIGNSVCVFVNGGGVSWQEPSDDEFEINLEDYKEDTHECTNEDYINNMHILISVSCDSEYKYLQIDHKTGYNQENMDIVIAYYE